MIAGHLDFPARRVVRGASLQGEEERKGDTLWCLAFSYLIVFFQIVFVVSSLLVYLLVLFGAMLSTVNIETLNDCAPLWRQIAYQVYFILVYINSRI